MTKLIPVEYQCCKLFYNPDTKKFSAVVTVQDAEDEGYTYYDLEEPGNPPEALKKELMEEMLDFVHNHIAHIDLLNKRTLTLLYEALQKRIDKVFKVNK